MNKNITSGLVALDGSVGLRLRCCYCFESPPFNIPVHTPYSHPPTPLIPFTPLHPLPRFIVGFAYPIPTFLF